MTAVIVTVVRYVELFESWQSMIVEGARRSVGCSIRSCQRQTVDCLASTGFRLHLPLFTVLLSAARRHVHHPSIKQRNCVGCWNAKDSSCHIVKGSSLLAVLRVSIEKKSILSPTKHTPLNQININLKRASSWEVSHFKRQIFEGGNKTFQHEILSRFFSAKN